VIASASLFPATEARAQFGLAGMGGEMREMLKPAVNSRQLKRYSDVLGLTPAQKQAADDLLAAYQGDFRDLVSRLEEVYQAVQDETSETGEWEMYQTVIPDAMIKFMKKSEKLNKGVLEDIKAVLSEQQAARFVVFERAVRRSGSFNAMFDGMQKVNLTELIDGLRLDPGAGTAIGGTVEQYETELDPILVRLDKTIKDFMEVMSQEMAAGRRPEEDGEKMAAFMKDVMESGKQVATVNEKYVRLITPQLPEDAQKELDLAVKTAKYPQVYKRSQAMRIISAAEALTDLEASQREGIKGIKETYERDAATANGRWTTAIDDVMGSGGDDPNSMMMMKWQLKENEKYKEAAAARKALDEKTVDSVRALLSEDQKAKLPSATKRPEFDMDAPLGTR